MMTKLDGDFIKLLFALTECRRALDSFAEVERLADVRVVRQPGVEVRENLRIFDCIRLGLQMAANVSRLFWPPKANCSARGRHLRALTGIPENHGLSDRRLRNHIEHLDERLDAWTEVSPRPFLAVELVLHDDFPTSGCARDATLEATAIIYDAKTQKVHLFGEVFLLRQITDNLHDAMKKISKAVEVLTERQFQ